MSPRIELINLIDKRLSQLNSLLHSCYGGGMENFDELGPECRDNLMWLASDLGMEIEGAMTQLKALDQKAGAA